MKHQVRLGVYPESGTVEVDEDACLSYMQNRCVKGFATPHGRRETAEDYRGCVIFRATRDYGYGIGKVTKRETTAYLFYISESGRADLHCISVGTEVSSVKEAKELIDTVLALGCCWYGMPIRATKSDMEAAMAAVAE